VSAQKEVPTQERLLAILETTLAITRLAHDTGMARKDGLIAFKAAAMCTNLVMEGGIDAEVSTTVKAFVLEEIAKAGPVYDEEGT
jgi:hypothetical protein